ncbi:MAG: cupin domain-containing protein [Ignavibacteriales bacterium]|jgi:Uncharacterized conserved protein, contains double-stranded beta-helix domain|nr:MAG: cupin domain-containing protein [Ignavibacteriaceae bacterium]MBW7872088.1 cupin domain-containing protein [Ignavibacteria bacterium]MCZ2143722.1 cupin domain-containing protein [Ignavibacteriales bacterium]OQY77563.1 MAG: cupin [Ignavibacteriales bacterium UTCHB3]MBV6446015.1 hypothetical protein [Ignavibacteriaceae bacterium]
MSKTDLYGKLSDLITYSEASIVSRQLIKNPAGNVTYFAYDKDENLSEHTSPYDALVIVVEGKMEVKIAGEPHILEAGMIIKLPANVPHALWALEPSKKLLVMIRG